MLYGRTKFIILSLLVTGTLLLLFSAILTPARSTLVPGDYESKIQPASSKAILSQCGDIWLFQPKPEWYGTIPEGYTGTIPTHPMIVPAYGFMSDKPFDYSKYETSKYGEAPYKYPEIIRALWEGDRIIWVGSTYPEEGYDFIRKYADQWNSYHEKKILVLSWTEKAALPLGRSLGFSSWDATQTCQSFEQGTFEDFMAAADAYNMMRDYGNPPPAELQDGQLPVIAPQSAP